MCFTAGVKQIFIDTSHVLSRACFFVLCPLHIALLNFFEEVRKRHISLKRTITAYTSVSFETCLEALEVGKVAASLSNQKQNQIGRDTFLQSSRPTIEKSLEH